MTSPTPQGPVFIVGAPRSGTTLLQYMLRSHPTLSLPTGESHFIIPYYRDAARYGELCSVEKLRALLVDIRRRHPEFVESDLHGITFDVDALSRQFLKEKRQTVRDVLTGLYEANAVGEGKTRWGDKTPYYVLHLPKILEWWPDAQIIHVVRDGRDVALSLFARRHDFGVYNTYFAAKYWEHYVRVGHDTGRSLSPTQYLEVRYEDLVGAPNATVERICSYLAIPFDQQVVNFKRSGIAGKTPLLQQPIQANNAEKWRTAMSALQVRIFEGAAGWALQLFQYPLTTSARLHPLPLRAIWRWHNALARRWKRTARILISR